MAQHFSYPEHWIEKMQEETLPSPANPPDPIARVPSQGTEQKLCFLGGGGNPFYKWCEKVNTSLNRSGLHPDPTATNTCGQREAQALTEESLRWTDRDKDERNVPTIQQPQVTRHLINVNKTPCWFSIWHLSRGTFPICTRVSSCGVSWERTILPPSKLFLFRG